jgi:HD superfamily phosphohydrolase
VHSNQRQAILPLTTEKDVLCVTLAGLLHDVGHGPFSHVFESFRKAVESDIANNPSTEELYSAYPKCAQDNWAHEDSSLLMIDSILETLGLRIDLNNLDKRLEQIGDGIDARSMRVFQHRCKSEKEDVTDKKEDILTSRDLVFVKECIYGKPLPDVKAKIGDRLIGREEPHKE